MKNSVKPINIVEYTRTHLNPITIEEYNEVDYAILAKFVYFNFEIYINDLNKDSLYIKDLYDFSKFDAFLKRPNYKKEDLTLLTYMCGSPRFRNIKIKNYVHNNDKNNLEQFAAITFILENNDEVIAFRGTDATITGWNEDFNMAIETPVPAQKDAENYLNKYGLETKKDLYIIGHSKGGNLALYSLLTANDDIYRKIKKVYSLDGPGLEPKYFKEFNHAKLKDLYCKIIPNESIIGMIFDTDEYCEIIKSNRTLLLQHNLYTWQVVGHKFVHVDSLNDSVKSFDISFNNWVKECNENERKLIIEMIFTIIKRGKATSADIINNKQNHYNISKMIGEYRLMAKNKKDEFKDLALRLIKKIFSTDDD
jgi:Protein of unknown function (DUF2974).